MNASIAVGAAAKAVPSGPSLVGLTLRIAASSDAWAGLRVRWYLFIPASGYSRTSCLVHGLTRVLAENRVVPRAGYAFATRCACTDAAIGSASLRP